MAKANNSLQVKVFFENMGFNMTLIKVGENMVMEVNPFLCKLFGGRVFPSDKRK